MPTMMESLIVQEVSKRTRSESSSRNFIFPTMAVTGGVIAATAAGYIIFSDNITVMQETMAMRGFAVGLITGLIGAVSSFNKL